MISILPRALYPVLRTLSLVLRTSYLVPLTTLALYAQQVDYKKIILPEGASNVSFEERLVQLAWQNNPASAIAKKEVSTAEYQAKAEGAKWTSMLGVQGNLNEFTIKQLSGSDDPETENLFYPRYNVFLNIPLSVFLNSRITGKPRG